MANTGPTLRKGIKSVKISSANTFTAGATTLEYDRLQIMEEGLTLEISEETFKLASGHDAHEGIAAKIEMQLLKVPDTDIATIRGWRDNLTPVFVQVVDTSNTATTVYSNMIVSAAHRVPNVSKGQGYAVYKLTGAEVTDTSLYATTVTP